MNRSLNQRDFLIGQALVRTAFSCERSLMAWIRTSVSLYTFGFSISTFIDFLQLQEKGFQVSVEFRRVGLVLIAVGIVAVASAVVDHLKRIRTMRRLGLPSSTRSVLPAATATALGLTGRVTLVGVWSA